MNYKRDMKIKVGDIVRLKPKHHLIPFIGGCCQITQIVLSNNKNLKPKYHIKNSKDSMTWVHLDEFDLVSEIRNEKLETLFNK